jgi:peptide/nickel transport system permease protein
VLRTIVMRIATIVPVLLLVSLGTFFLVNLIPGSPEVEILGPNASAQDYARAHHELGLDKPVVERYFTWLGNAATGRFGRNLIPPTESVSARLARAVPVSVELAAMALFIALALAIPAAMVSAHRPGGRVDRLISLSAFGLISVPSFLSGIILILVFAVNWKVFPDRLWVRPSTGGWGQNLRHAVLPAFTIALNEVAIFARLLRNDLIVTLREDYILAARAKGMPPRHILLREALRPSSFSLITLAGVSLGRLIGGTVIVERLFTLPGLGSVIVDAANKKDITIVQAGVLVIAVGYIVINAAIDLLYGALDPRIRRGRV